MGQRTHRGLGMLVALVAGGCTAFEPIAPVPPQTSFDEVQAQELLEKAQAAEAVGDFETAHGAFTQAVERWPVLEPAWTGLVRVNKHQGNEDEARLAHFLEERVAEYDALHPRQARLVFVGAAATPPEGLPTLKPWAERLVAFFEEKDLRAQRAAFDARQKPSLFERYLIYPVAIGSVAALTYSAASITQNFGKTDKDQE